MLQNSFSSALREKIMFLCVKTRFRDQLSHHIGTVMDSDTVSAMCSSSNTCPRGATLHTVLHSICPFYSETKCVQGLKE